MSLKTTAIFLFARRTQKVTNRSAARARQDQEKWRQRLITKAESTQFGKDHHFSEIKTAEQFRHHVPIRDYEGLRPYIDQIVGGKANILWPGRPKYFAKTSGTTSGVKYIPISKDSIGYHISSARMALVDQIRNID